MVVQAVIYPPVAALLALAGVRVAAFGPMMAAALLLAHWAALRWVDGRGWDEVALGRPALRPAAIRLGLGAGSLAIAAPTLLLLAIGWLDLAPAPDGGWWATAGSVAAFLLPAALWEELLFRGYPLRVLADAAGAGTALVVTSVLFGGVHLWNAGATAQSTAIVTLAGFFLGAVLLRTRSLYAAWAAHWGWNWTMAAVFHVAVSGNPFPTPDYRVVDAGPDWATGGSWGPEGGAPAAAAMLGGVALLLRGRRANESATSTAARAPRRTNVE